MCQTFRLDSTLWLILLSLDRELAEMTRAQGCRCGGALHAAFYARKPRGCSDLDPEAKVCFSFCCAREGCRKRARAPSTRFLGRRVFLGAVVVLVSALRQGPNPRRMRVLREHFGVDRRTIERWQAWWRDEFPRTRCWRTLRGRVLISATAELPFALVEILDAWVDETQQALLLHLLSPPSVE